MAMVCGRGKQTTEGMLTKVLRSEGYARWRRQQRISGQDAKGGPYRVRPDFIFRCRRSANLSPAAGWLCTLSLSGYWRERAGLG